MSSRNPDTQIPDLEESKALDHQEMAYWIAKEYGERVIHSGTARGTRWRLDGRITSVPEIWMRLIYPRIASGEIQISFQQNTQDMYRAFEKVTYAKHQMEREAGHGQ